MTFINARLRHLGQEQGLKFQIVLHHSTKVEAGVYGTNSTFLYRWLVGLDRVQRLCRNREKHRAI